MNIRSAALLSVSSALLGLSAPRALAQLHAGDVVLYVSGGAVVTAGSAGGAAFADTRVFVSSFGAQGVPDFSTDPGFNTVPGQFPASQLFGITIEGAARRWTPPSGQSGGDFCTVPGETISVYRGQLLVSTLGGPAGPVPAPPLPPAPSLALGQTASGTGFVHTHPTYAINPAVVGSPITNGIYLVQMRAWSGVPSGGVVAPSTAFYLLLSQNAPPADLDASRLWLEARLALGAGGDAALCPPASPPACPADFDADGARTVADIFAFLGAWFSGDPRADVDASGVRDVTDIFVFLGRWFAGCP